MQNEPMLLRCHACGTLNRVLPDKLSARPVCGKCKTRLDIPMFPVDATTASFERDVFDWPGYALVEFWSKLCGYCRMIEPVVNDIASWRVGRLKVVKVEINSEPGLANRFAVKATPAFIIFKNGEQIGRMDGAPKEKIQLVNWVDQFIR